MPALQYELAFLSLIFLSSKYKYLEGPRHKLYTCQSFHLILKSDLTCQFVRLLFLQCASLCYTACLCLPHFPTSFLAAAIKTHIHKVIFSSSTVYQSPLLEAVIIQE